MRVPWPPYPHPIAIFIVIVIVMIILGIYGCATDESTQTYGNGYSVASADSVPIAPPSKYDAEMDTLTHEALEEAFRAKLAQLFSVWLRDETGQPARAMTGAVEARKAYIAVRNELEKREQFRERLREKQN